MAGASRRGRLLARIDLIKMKRKTKSWRNGSRHEITLTFKRNTLARRYSRLTWSLQATRLLSARCSTARLDRFISRARAAADIFEVSTTTNFLAELQRVLIARGREVIIFGRSNMLPREFSIALISRRGDMRFGSASAWSREERKRSY